MRPTWPKTMGTGSPLCCGARVPHLHTQGEDQSWRLSMFIIGMISSILQILHKLHLFNYQAPYPRQLDFSHPSNWYRCSSSGQSILALNAGYRYIPYIYLMSGPNWPIHIILISHICRIDVDAHPAVLAASHYMLVPNTSWGGPHAVERVCGAPWFFWFLLFLFLLFTSSLANLSCLLVRWSTPRAKCQSPLLTVHHIETCVMHGMATMNVLHVTIACTQSILSNYIDMTH
jgi:hypothetical protein